MNTMGWHRPSPLRWPQGFTLLELMVVLAIVALLTGVITIQLRPHAPHQLGRESERLAVWLEAARHLARAEGRVLQVRFSAQGAELIGLTDPRTPQPSLPWLYPGRTQVRSAQTVWLGPEAMLPAQRLELMMVDEPQWSGGVWTSGLGPWRRMP